MDETGKHHAESRKPDKPDHINIFVCNIQTASLQRYKVHLQLLELGSWERAGRKWEVNINRGFLAIIVVKIVAQL